jgi:hypothetical protein
VIKLRLGKKTEKTGIGMRKDPDAKMKPMRKIGKTKKGNEQRVLKVMKELIIQEVSEAEGIPRRLLKKLDLDHIAGRDEPGFAPLGAILSPLNLQLLTRVKHDTKTNALTLEGQRMDFRSTLVQARMIELNYRLVKKLGPVWDLRDLKDAIDSEIYSEEA